MKFSASLLVITTLLRLGKSAQAMHQSAFDAEYQDLPEEESQRFLADVCGTYYYTTNIGMGSKQSLTCSDSQLKTIGAKIDELYDEVVILDPALSHIKLTTTVCPTPEVVTNKRRDLLSQDGNHRALMPPFLYLSWVRYNWAASGRCGFSCNPDNKDKRRDLSAFEGEEMDLQERAQHHERGLREAYSVIDFSKDSNGKPVTKGQYVMNEWRDKYGMRIVVEDAKGGYAPNGKARIFDSTNTKWDLDLASPNKKCPGGGPGIGSEGAPGKPGENCIPHGNLLIIQRSNSNNPDDNPVGGVLSFIFDSPKRVGHIAMIEGSNKLEVTTHDGKTIVFNFPSLGENAVQRLRINLVVTKMRMILNGGGGLSEIGIFVPTEASHALSPEARSYLAEERPFEELIPYLELDLSIYLTTRINEIYGRDSSSCLYSKYIIIDVEMNAVNQPPTATCQ